MSAIAYDKVAFIAGANGPCAPVILTIDFPEHPMPLQEAAVGLNASVVTVPVCDWNRYLTPWEAPGLRTDAPSFGGKADELLQELRNTLLPYIRDKYNVASVTWAIAGYSLGGLFALYAFMRDLQLCACGCVSGSVWYPGLIDYVQEHARAGAGRYAYFSLGKKERRGGAPIMHSVQDNMETCTKMLVETGYMTDFVLGPGNHMQHHTERMYAAFGALDAFMGRQELTRERAN